MEKDNEILLQKSSDDKKKYLKIILLIIGFIITVSIVVTLVLLLKNNKKDPEYKHTSIRTVPIPKGINYDGDAIYSKTGHIILSYKKENDNDTYFGVIDEDGKNLKKLWSGNWTKYYNSNGIRLMPFDDNKRILTGDYVLECYPNIDNCQNSTLLPVIYPSQAVNMSGVYMVWSEIIVSPDEHIGWSTLSSKYGDVNFIGKLKKTESNYTIENIQIISTLGFIEYEDITKGVFKRSTIRGGEIKQFTNGGEAITLAGASETPLAKSMFQNLVGEENYQLTNFPGYEETTIISPDGKLGLLMTTRFSPKTSSYILGYMPRPLSVHTVSKMNRFAYFYGVQEVRKKRQGNIGPALINIQESKADPSYMGFDLHEEGWVFNSPMSWHPSNKKAMFSENKKDSKIKRIRIVYLDNYKPSKIIENKKTPDNISYAKSLDDLNTTTVGDVNGYFNGKKSGIMKFNRTQINSKSEYLNFSDDGKIFYNGYEEFQQIDAKTGKLISKVNMSGSKTGCMNLSLTMNYNGEIIEKNGFVDYNGKRININDAY